MTAVTTPLPYLVLGVGRSGIAAAQLLMQEGHLVFMTDDNTDKEQACPQLSFFVPMQKAHQHLTQHQYQAVVLSPGVPRTHDLITQALQLNIPVLNELEIGAERLPNCLFAGITGTNGKSTTTAMLGSILKQADAQAFAGGNLGTPLCEAVSQGLKPRYAALELSSFQLETMHHLPLRAAVITNLSPDHLDRYPSIEAYYATKQRIYDLLVPTGVAVRDYHQTSLPAFENPRIVGQHNIENAQAAVALARALQIEETAIAQGLNAYPGIPHRLELLGSIGGVSFVNDSKATNVESALVAIQAFAGGIHLIAGGVGKKSSYAPLVKAALGKVKAVYVIGEDAALITEAFAPHMPVIQAGTLQMAFTLAAQASTSGDVILLAPACASYDQFHDYAHRGNTFRQLFEETERAYAENSHF